MYYMLMLTMILTSCHSPIDAYILAHSHAFDPLNYCNKVVLKKILGNLLFMLYLCAEVAENKLLTHCGFEFHKL